MKRLLLCTLLALALALCGCQVERDSTTTPAPSLLRRYSTTRRVARTSQKILPFMFRIILRPIGFAPMTLRRTPSAREPSTSFLPRNFLSIEELPPEKGIIKGVFTCDYTEQSNGIRIHRFTSPMRRQTASLCATHKFMAKACSLSPSRATSLPSTCGSPGLYLLTPVVSGFRATSIITERNIPLTSVFKPAQKRRNAIAFRRFLFPQRGV